MNKEDLENGMIIQTRDGVKYLYCEGVIRSKNVWSIIESYRDDLTSKELPEFDIIKVYKDSKAYSLGHLLIGGCTKEKLIWERPKPPKLSKKEIEILKALDVIGFTHIARDKSGNIFAYLSKPFKDLEMEVWFFHSDIHPDEMQTIKLKRDLFAFVTWIDKEPTNILDLLSVLKEGEKENE